MPNFNFMPSVMGVSFYRHYKDAMPEENITEINTDKISNLEHPDDYNLGIRLTLSGLDYLRNPLTKEDDIDKNYETFYLNIATYTQRGDRDYVVDKMSTTYVDEEILKKGKATFDVIVAEFPYGEPIRFDDMEQDFEYDFISNIMFVRAFTTKNFIETHTELNTALFAGYNLLFESKLPKIDKKAWEWRRSESDF